MSFLTLLAFLVLHSWVVQAGQSHFHPHFPQPFTALWVARSAEEPGDPCWPAVLLWFLTETRVFLNT